MGAMRLRSVRLFSVATIICTAMAAASLAQNAANTHPDWSDNVVIFSPEQVNTLQGGPYDPLRTLGLRSVDWTPSLEDVGKVEATLAAHLRSNRSESIRQIADRLSDYKRQYFGYTAGAGRWIFLYAFCDPGDDTFWRMTVP